MFCQAFVSIAAALKVLLHAKTAQTAQKALLDANLASASKMLQTAQNAKTAHTAEQEQVSCGVDQNTASQVVIDVMPIAKAANP